MAMGIVSDAELEKELQRNGVPEKGTIEILPDENRGRKPGDVNVPESLRKVIAEDHIENGRESAIRLAGEFGISASSVSAYAHGSTSTTSYKEGNPGLRSHVKQVREKIAGKARKRLGWALNQITEEKLSVAKLKDVASIAKDMSVIIKQMEPEQNEGGDRNTNVQVVLFSPQLMQEVDFPRMRVKE